MRQRPVRRSPRTSSRSLPPIARRPGRPTTSPDSSAPVARPSTALSPASCERDAWLGKARLVKNPVEAAFFLWVQVAYLQPFEDGNERTSRLAANLPLILSNCAPLSFLDVEVQDYACAMLGVYERNDVRLATELFEWTYRRSIEKYRVVRESLGAPDPLRTRYREQVGELVRRVVSGSEALDAALVAVELPEDDRLAVREVAHAELGNLETYNCARFRLAMSAVERWIAAGRPGR